jgi:hypothetical protein
MITSASELRTLAVAAGPGSPARSWRRHMTLRGRPGGGGEVLVPVRAGPALVAPALAEAPVSGSAPPRPASSSRQALSGFPPRAPQPGMSSRPLRRASFRLPRVPATAARAGHDAVSIYEVGPDTGLQRSYRASGNPPDSYQRRSALAHHTRESIAPRMYEAAWAEYDMPGGNAGGALVPMAWEQARDTLAAELERNLDRWPGVHGDRAAYERALAEIRDAPEPASGGRSWALTYHVLSITPRR